MCLHVNLAKLLGTAILQWLLLSSLEIKSLKPSNFLQLVGAPAVDLKATVQKLKISINESLLESFSLQLNHPFEDAHEAALKNSGDHESICGGVGFAKMKDLCLKILSNLTPQRMFSWKPTEIHRWSNLMQKTYRWKALGFIDLSAP